MTGTCKYCGCQIHKDGDSWVDNSGGDVCGIDGDNKLHADILDDEMALLVRYPEVDGCGALLACQHKK